jgi:hypothetical protein
MGWTDETSGAFGSVEITDQRARYLVLYSSAKQQAGNTYWEQSPAAFSAEAPVKMAAAGSFKVPHGPDGAVWIGLMDKTFKDAVDNAICGKPEQGNGVLNTLRESIPVPGWGSSSSKSADAKNSGAKPTDGASPASNSDAGKG